VHAAASGCHAHCCHFLQLKVAFDREKQGFKKLWKKQKQSTRLGLGWA
jgi:hypothetical protein